MKNLLRVILVPAICGILACVIVRLIRPLSWIESSKEFLVAIIIWAVLFLVYILGETGISAYRFHKEEKNNEIREGKRSIG